jgi:alpha-D-ribose 1-methylphosphonate 5-triphosphate synthase subunit PhnH
MFYLTKIQLFTKLFDFWTNYYLTNNQKNVTFCFIEQKEILNEMEIFLRGVLDHTDIILGS